IGVHFNYQNYADWERFEQHLPGPPAVSDQQLYEEDLHLAGLVEPLGFDAYWAIDHHFSPYIMTGGAIQHLTYMAGKTSRIDVGTMVIVLPWYDPVVVAEQVSVLDNLLQGRRLTLGLGRGAAKRETASPRRWRSSSWRFRRSGSPTMASSTTFPRRRSGPARATRRRCWRD